MSSAVSIASRKSWVLVREQSKFVDWQKVKVQEKSDEVPVTQPCSTVQHRAMQCKTVKTLCLSKFIFECGAGASWQPSAHNGGNLAQ